jgi:hypothetical protein
MSIITLEFDNKLKKSEIIVPLLSSSPLEGGTNYNDTGLTDKAQTSVMGIQMPLIMINTTVIDFDAVKFFKLSSTDVLPTLNLTVEDRYELIANIDKPGNDNEVRVQILPRFDNAYKKIDLTFFIDSIDVYGSLISLSCSYKLSDLTSSQYKTFGELDTYSLFKQIATETGLGFATNISEMNDTRFIYSNNKSYLDLMYSEINFANASEHIIDYWIDFWDNINLVDIKERYNAIDDKEDMQIWIAGQVNEVSIDNEAKPQLVTATVNDLPMYNNSELFVKEYTIKNNPGANIGGGTDRVYSIYEDTKKEYSDYYVQDGDVKEDIFINYEYIGEVYGDYNYLIAEKLREAYMQKMFTETVNIKLQSPLLGLMRGHRINFIRYVNNSMVENKLSVLEENGVIDRNIECNIPLDEYEVDVNTDNGKFIIDRTASGQYLITGVNIEYENQAWNYILELVKPQISNVSIMNKSK